MIGVSRFTLWFAMRPYRMVVLLYLHRNLERIQARRSTRFPAP